MEKKHFRKTLGSFEKFGRLRKFQTLAPLILSSQIFISRVFISGVHGTEASFLGVLRF